MAGDLSSIKFEMNDKHPSTMAELVRGWNAFNDVSERKCRDEHAWAFDCALELCKLYPTLALQFVLAVLEENLEPRALAVLAAGPLEDLLAYHGPEIIEQVEMEARRSPQFRYLIGGVWQNSMSNDIWERVLKAGPERW